MILLCRLTVFLLITSRNMDFSPRPATKCYVKPNGYEAHDNRHACVDPQGFRVIVCGTDGNAQCGAKGVGSAQGALHALPFRQPQFLHPPL